MSDFSAMVSTAINWLDEYYEINQNEEHQISINGFNKAGELEANICSDELESMGLASIDVAFDWFSEGLTGAPREALQEVILSQIDTCDDQYNGALYGNFRVKMLRFSALNISECEEVINKIQVWYSHKIMLAS